MKIAVLTEALVCPRGRPTGTAALRNWCRGVGRGLLRRSGTELYSPLELVCAYINPRGYQTYHFYSIKVLRGI